MTDRLPDIEQRYNQTREVVYRNVKQWRGDSERDAEVDMAWLITEVKRLRVLLLAHESGLAMLERMMGRAP